MKYAIGPLVAVILATRVVMVVRRRKRRDSDSSARGADRPARRPAAIGSLEMLGDGVGLVALREIRERVRGRVFRVGTLIILLAVAAAVVIPTIGSKKHQNEKVGIVGGLDSSLRILVVAAGKTAGATVQLVSEPSLARAEGDLRAGNIGLAIVGGQRLVVNQPLSSSDTSTDALMARSVAASLGLANGLTSAGLSPDKAVQVAHSPPLPVESLQPAEHNSTAKTTSVYGLILTYVLLTQYGTWLLMGVIEEKSSRVIEVLVSTMRPSKLLAGKVIGIGTVAFLQSALIVAVALGLGAAVGSTLLHGSSPLDVLDILLWLVLGYAFYCWVYAAGGSLADRQSQVQSLAFPLQLPVLFGYIVSLTSLGSSQASTLMKVLAYLPPTAPFAMPTLVALGQATWWEAGISFLIMIAGIVLVSRVASFVYYRAILRTGGRVRLRQVFSGT